MKYVKLGMYLSLPSSGDQKKDIYKDKTNKTTRLGKNNNNTSPIAEFY